MRKIISLIILITFLLTNTAYPLTALRPPIDKVKKRTRKVANAAVYLKIAKWINKNIGNKGDIKKIISELKDGKLVFEYEFKEPVFKDKSEESGDVFEVDFEGAFYSVFKVDFVRGFYSMYELRDRRFDYSHDLDDYKRTMLRIPEDISKLASKVLRKSPNPISEYGIKYLNQSNVDLISSIVETRGLKFKLDEKITENIVKCLYSLGEKSLASRRLKRVIVKKLLKIQQKIPETKPIIRERALELLEIDRENFKERLKPFIGDYIAFRGAIREIGLKDDTAGFYNLFDEIVTWTQTGQHEKDFLDAMDFIEEIPEDLTLSESSLPKRKLKVLRFVDDDMWFKIYWLKKKGVDFRIIGKSIPGGVTHETDWAEPYNVISKKYKRSQGGRFSVYPKLPKQGSPGRKIIHSGSIEHQTVYASTLKHKTVKHKPKATFEIVIPAEHFFGQLKDLQNIRSQV